MAVSPNDAAQIAQEVATIFREAELRLIASISRRLEQGIDAPGWAERKLAQIGAMRREAEATVAALARATPARVQAAVNAAYSLGSKAAGAELSAAGLTLGQVTSGEAIRALVAETVGSLNLSFLTALRSVDDMYRQIISQETSQILAGTVTRRQATQRAWTRLVDQGVTGFVDRAGRKWQLDTYAEMATRTSAGRAAVNGHVDRMVASGEDLVVVSDSPEECPICRPWEGQIMSLSGRDQRYPALETARSAGLFHPNCTHSVGLWVPGTRKPKAEANPAGYEARQQQRYNERQVRKWKRREVSALDPDSAARARQNVRTYQKRLRDSGRPRQRAREQLPRRAKL